MTGLVIFVATVVVALVWAAISKALEERKKKRDAETDAKPAMPRRSEGGSEWKPLGELL